MAHTLEESAHYVLVKGVAGGEHREKDHISLLNKANGMAISFTGKDIKRWNDAYAKHLVRHPDAAASRRLDDLWTKFFELAR